MLSGSEGSNTRGFVGCLSHLQLGRAGRFLNGIFLESSDPDNFLGNDNPKLAKFGWALGFASH